VKYYTLTIDSVCGTVFVYKIAKQLWNNWKQNSALHYHQCSHLTTMAVTGP